MDTTMAVGASVGAATRSWRRAPPTSIVCGATGKGSHCSPRGRRGDLGDASIRRLNEALGRRWAEGHIWQADRYWACPVAALVKECETQT